MLVSIIGENTFKVGDRILIVGEEIDVTEMPPIEVSEAGSIPASALQQKLVDLNAWIRNTKEELLMALHLSEEAYNESTATMCWNYINAHRDWAFFVDLLFKAIEKHMGGGIPLLISPDTGKITVRTLQQNPQDKTPENLNWTHSMIGRQVQFPRYAGVRSIVKDLFGPDRQSEVSFDVSLLASVGLPCLVVPKSDVEAPEALVDNENQEDGVEALANVGVKAFKALQASAPVCLVWVEEEQYTFVDLKERLMSQQPGQAGTPLPVLLQQVQKVLGAPKVVGLLMFGDLGNIADGKRGLIAISDNGKTQAHFAMAVEGEEFEKLSSGKILNVADQLAEIFKTLVKKEEKK